MKPVGEVIQRCGLWNHQYTDDTQLYLSFSTSPGEAVAVLNRCLAEVMGWIRAIKLNLNPDKTEVLLVGGLNSWVGDLDLVLNGVALPLKDRICILGVLLDPELTLEAQVSAVVRSTFHQLRLTHQLRPYLEDDCLATVTQALVTSRLDFCNALYVGLTVWILQMVQNRAARLLTRTGRYSHITPVLCQLHWLPIEVRAQFKVLVITYKALNSLGPGYLKERLQPYLPSRPLRLAAGALLREPSVRDIRKQRRRNLYLPFTLCTEFDDMPLQPTKSRRNLCEEALLKIKGVISFTFQMAVQRCVVRIRSDLKAEALATAIASTKVMKAQQVVKSESGEEMLVPFQDTPVEVEQNTDLPEYLPEDESPSKEQDKAVSRVGSHPEGAASWLSTAANFLSRSFYW
ncbi:Armadillo repeat-containing protein 1 [Varanus komodoensis]|nr:Armadillo repeat-containing protein 1 [Varanus komodoensis]